MRWSIFAASAIGLQVMWRISSCDTEEPSTRSFYGGTGWPIMPIAYAIEGFIDFDLLPVLLTAAQVAFLMARSCRGFSKCSASAWLIHFINLLILLRFKVFTLTPLNAIFINAKLLHSLDRASGWQHHHCQDQNTGNETEEIVVIPLPHTLGWPCSNGSNDMQGNDGKWPLMIFDM